MSEVLNNNIIYNTVHTTSSNINNNINNSNGNYKTTSVYSNIRYTLSSKLMNEYFLQFTSVSSTKNTVNKLIKDVKENPTGIVSLLKVFICIN